MILNRVTVTLPEPLYRRLRFLAEQTNREIEAVLIASAEAMLALEAQDAALPPDVADHLAAMRLFSDEALWQAIEPGLSPAQQTRLTELSHKQGQTPLTNTEQAELNELLAEYDRAVLYRAQALALLALRGHPIPDLNMPEPT
jgi:predicted transcriptional regulator